MDQRSGVYTIPSGTGFLEALAKGLLQRAGPDGEGLARMRILLPTRRAGRELRDEFLKLSKGRPLLLPRIQPIGDVDAEEVELMLTGLGDIAYNIPPAISSLERQFLLSQLVRSKDPDMGLDTALKLASDLARLIDTVHTEDLDFSGLAQIVPEDLSEYWKQTLEFLDIVTANWPLILAERGQIDPADRRNRLLKAVAKLWREHPPETPVIAAGSTGSIPSSGELLKVISKLPQGLVVLPGLDKSLDDESWDAVTDGHPQATMKNLLKRMGIGRSDVSVWPESIGKTSNREALLRAIMRPKETFAADNQSVTSGSLDNLSLIEASNAREEAAVIALALRETLEIKGQTACLVTPDRTLARRVMTALHRWGIEVDDSAGGALATTQSATYLGAILKVIEENFAPLPLLDFLKHDYQRLIDKDQCKAFELSILRGARPAPGISGLITRLLRREKELPERDLIIFKELCSKLQDGFSGMMGLTQKEACLEKFVTALIETAEFFSGGKSFFWTRAESNAISAFLSGVMGYSDLIPDIELKIFGGVFRELLMAENYRAEDEPHRRILILGQMESRLIRRDVMILGGLNEGVWPRDPGHDPWMSRPMRKKFGLPSVERGTGLAAHDFVEHCSSPKVLITRSLRNAGTATVPARWIQKLRTVLKAATVPEKQIGSQHYLQWSRRVDTAGMTVEPLLAPVPAPCPPLERRPRVLSATSVEKWIKNPYRIYADKIMRLKTLDPIDKDTVHADRGSFVHDVLLDFVKNYPTAMPDNAKEIILEIANQKLAQMEHVSLQWKYWWPRFERLIDWFVNEETNWRKSALPWVQEEKGEWEIYRNEKTQREFTVTAKADRIDRLKEGGVAILDYKTGSLPPVYGLKDGTAPQLPIEALIAAKGGYRGQPHPPQMMVYWKLSGSFSGAGKVEDRSKNLDMEDILIATEDGLSKLVEKFEDPHTPYLARAQTGKLYDDDKAYAHLARTAEWSSGGVESSEDETQEGEE